MDFAAFRKLSEEEKDKVVDATPTGACPSDLMERALAGAAAVFLVQQYTNIHLLLYAFVGISTCCVVGYLASMKVRGSGKSIAGLTIHTLDKTERNEI